MKSQSNTCMYYCVGPGELTIMICNVPSLELKYVTAHQLPATIAAAVGCL